MDEKDEDKIKEYEKENDETLNYIKTYLNEYVDRVKINLYLNEDIPCIITSQ
jgi:hypothetical protein